jgi:hypothetical protein
MVGWIRQVLMFMSEMTSELGLNETIEHIFVTMLHMYSEGASSMCRFNRYARRNPDVRGEIVI